VGSSNLGPRATPDERSDSKRNSFGLFLFGLALVCIGAGFDPTRHSFDSPGLPRTGISRK
jgi:hypothetical protein